MDFKILDIGISHYPKAFNLQKDLLAKIKNGKADNHIILTEHYPVFTIGRSGTRNNILVSEQFLKQRQIEVIEIDRGGDITYHGPGQIIIYPIIKLSNKDLHKYLRFLESVVISFLAEYNIESFRIVGKTGVWTNRGKIASIGIAVSRWVVYHGISINVDCDLTPFKWINPCGFKNIDVTSMKEIGAQFSKDGLKHELIEIFSNLTYPASQCA